MTDPLRRELLPCPFCGGTSLDITKHRASCNDCGAVGPIAVLNAGLHWNDRAPSPEIASPRHEAPRGHSE